MNRTQQNELNESRQKGKILFPTNEFEALVKGAAKVARNSIKEGTEKIYPRLLFVLDTMTDTPLRGITSDIREKFRDASGVVPMFVRPMAELNVDMPEGEERRKMMFDIGKDCPLRVVGIVLVAEMCSSKEQGIDPRTDPAGQLLVGIAGQTIDKRNFLINYKVKINGSGNLQIMSEDWVRGADFPLMDEFWKGYLSSMKARKENGEEVDYEDFKREDTDNFGDIIVMEPNPNY